MDRQNYFSPSEITELTIQTAARKTQYTVKQMLLLGILAGAFIAFASEASNMASYTLLASPETYGLGKALAGLIFGAGLMLVIIAGGELFTGNTMMIVGVLDRKIHIAAMLKNWFFVYLGNFIGAVLIAFLMDKSGLFHCGAEELGAMTIKIAAGKVSLSFAQAFILGIMCNWLVCLAVWMSYAAFDITGKILAVFFPIWLFITSGFEHCIANMYYIPAAIFAKKNKVLVETAGQLGVTAEKIAHINWKTFLISNLFPVTLGNVIGGSICVAAVYWYVYIHEKKR